VSGRLPSACSAIVQPLGSRVGATLERLNSIICGTEAGLGVERHVQTLSHRGVSSQSNLLNYGMVTPAWLE
jgi:hypothetical protein